MTYHKKRGIVLLDLLIGMVIVAILGGLLASSINKLNWTATQLEHSRAALRTQQAMVYATLATPADRRTANPALHPCPNNAPAQSPAGYRWAYIASRQNGLYRRRLYALVPQASVAPKVGGTRR